MSCSPLYWREFGKGEQRPNQGRLPVGQAEFRAQCSIHPVPDKRTGILL